MSHIRVIVINFHLLVPINVTISPIDFNKTTGNNTFTVTITVPDDMDIDETNKTVNITLKPDAGNKTVVVSETITVVIIDDDSK